jgi:hypothetical protein
LKTLLTTIAVALSLMLSSVDATADYKVVSFDKVAGVLTVDQNGTLKSFRISNFTDVTINGVKASADQLRAGMMIALTLSNPQTVVRVVASGNPGTSTTSATDILAKPPAGRTPAPLPRLVGAVNGTRRIMIKMRVDGQDTVKIRDGQLWIEHGGWGKPDAISINGVRWQPNWEGKKTDMFTGFVPALAPFANSNVSIKKHLGRGDAKLIEPPTNANDNTLSIYINDQRSGSEFYEVRISW